MRKLLVTLDGCHYCEQAKQELDAAIVSGSLEVMDLNDVIDQLTGFECFRHGRGYAVPQLALVDDNNHILDCGIAGDQDAQTRILSYGK